MTCLTTEELRRMARGEHDPGATTHVAGCATCRDRLAVVDLLDRPMSDEETAAVEAILQRPAPLPRPRSRRLVALAAAAAIAGLGAVGLTFLRSGGVERDLAAAVAGPVRRLQPRLSLDLPYARYAPQRSAARADPDLDALEGRLLGDHDAALRLAQVYLLRGGPGDLQRAARALDRAAPNAAALNDRAVLHLLEGKPAEALDALQRAATLDPELPALSFNLALVYEALGRGADAKVAWERAARGDDAWSAEARERLNR